MTKAQIIVIGLIVAVFIVDMPCHVCHAAESSIRHEITTDIRWISTEYTYNHYSINAESFPTVSGERRNDYQHVMSSYSFFLTPISHAPNMPFALERFYVHPSVFTVSLSLQPESDSRHLFQNPEQNFQTSTRLTPRSRQATIHLEYYPWENTGFLLSIQSAKYEDLERFSDSLGNQRRGEHDEIRRSYSFGLSHYLFEDLKMRFTYTISDFEYLAYKSDLERENPFLNIESVEEAETDGYALSTQIEYILKERWKFSGRYEFGERERQSSLFSPYYSQLPDSTLLYDDDRTYHAVHTLVTVYLTPATALYAGGNLAWNQQKRTYSTDQITENGWDATTLEAGLSYDVNRRVGIRFGYEFSHEDGDVLIWHPESELDLRTEYQTNNDVHTLSCGITGRF